MDIISQTEVLTITYSNGTRLILTLGKWTTEIGQMFWNGLGICKTDEITLGKYKEIVFVTVD